LHKLVFEADVLPDGTEVAYYSDGKVASVKDGFCFTFFNDFHLFWLCFCGAFRNYWPVTKRDMEFFV